MSRFTDFLRRPVSLRLPAPLHRPPKRDLASLGRISDSLAVIARCLALFCEREYGVDMLAPPDSRAANREILAPMYPDNLAEAVREEVERMERIERDTLDELDRRRAAADPLRRAPVSTGPLGGLASSMTGGEGGDGAPLTAEEEAFLAELDAETPVDG